MGDVNTDNPNAANPTGAAPTGTDQSDAGRSSEGSIGTRVHAFGDDPLGADDAVALAARVRSGDVSPAELAAAAIARAEQVDGTLHAVALPMYDRPRTDSLPTAPLYGVPTFLKDNRDLVGEPTTTAARPTQPTRPRSTLRSHGNTCPRDSP